MKRLLSWRVLVALLALTLMAAACGGDDDDALDDAADAAGDAADAADDAAEDAGDAADDAADAAEDAADDAADAADDAADAAGDAADDAEDAADDAADAVGGGIAVTLNDDFEILLDSDPAAGTNTFNVSNEGPDFPHALTIVRAASIDDLPRNDANGAVDTDAMDPADIVGSTTIPLAGGTSEDLEVDLEAGDYVFFCPIQNETQSHVGAGQIMSVSVS